MRLLNISVTIRYQITLLVLPDLCTGVWMVEAGWMLEADVGCMGSEPKLSIMGRVTSIQWSRGGHTLLLHPGPPAQYCQHSATAVLSAASTTPRISEECIG